MITISLCMIVKDEEETIGKCLSGAQKFVDEIIIVDTGSRDKTKEIAKSFGAKIYDLKWEDNFSKARNYAFSKATKEYIMWLDGDDSIDIVNIEKIIELKSSLNKSYNGINMIYALSRNSVGEILVKSRRNRIVKRELGFKWIGNVHEYLEVLDPIFYTDIEISHNKKKKSGDRNLKIFERMEKENIEFSPRDLFYYGNELYDNGLLNKAYRKYMEFIDGENGWEGDIKKAILRATYCLEDTEGKIEEKKKLLLKIAEKYTLGGESCCALGNLFLKENKYQQAIFWYKAALNIDENPYTLEIENPQFTGWIPAINLCVCYCGLEELKKAYYYNELARLRGGEIEKIEYNKRFLETKSKEKGISLEKLEPLLIWK